MYPSRTLLGGLLVATSVATLLLPAVPAVAAPEPDVSGVARAEVADSPDLSPAEAGQVVFSATDSGNTTDGSMGPAATITCLFGVTDPFVALQPTEVQATTRVDCDARLPVVVVGVALYRQGSNSSLSNAVATGFATSSAQVHTFTPCQTSAYVALGTVTAFAPPGFSPPVAHRTAVSNVVLLAATGDAFPPFTCERPPQPPPAPPANPPTLGPAPVISSMSCEYIGGQRYNCRLSASAWTQIRWTYNGSPIPAGNNRTNLPPSSTCGGGIPTIKVFVSNQFGTTTRQDSFRCEGPPL